LNPPATLDDWRRFAAADWVRRLRGVHLDGANLSEPLRALRETHVPTALTDVYFHRASSPGIEFMVSDLLKSRLGETVRGLHFRTGHEGLEGLIDALTHDGLRFERLSLGNMGLTAELVRQWCERGGPLRLAELDLRDNRLGSEGMWVLPRGLAGSALRVLGLAGVDLTVDAMEALVGCEPLASLRRLDLSRNPLSPRATKLLSGAWPLAGVRALNLSRCRIGDKGVRHLTGAKFWPKLVELDLRENPITWRAVAHLLLAPVPADLTALLLDGSEIGVDSRAALRQKFGDAVIFEG
ncbi:MAG TPA: hypothetical protein VKE74_00605, partial [Gemmataceae bacterium]|nr:hypothetical protein [Gemmataceae bacterium]